MKNNYTVYLLKSPIGKVYIGTTSRSVKERWSNGRGYKTQLIFEDIVKYGWINFEKIIIAQNLCEQDAYQIEKEYILKYQSNNFEFGYNINSGGIGGNGIEKTEVQRQRLIEQSIKMWQNESVRDKIINAHKKPIDQYTTDGQFIKSYKSAKDAQEELNLPNRPILSKGTKPKRSYGFVWVQKGHNFIPLNPRPPISEETREKLRQASLRQVYTPRTDEQKENIRRGAIQGWKNRKEKENI